MACETCYIANLPKFEGTSEGIVIGTRLLNTFLNVIIVASLLSTSGCGDSSQAGSMLGGGHVTLSAGSSHSVVLNDDGTVWSWGDNSYGELGDGTNNNSTTPVQAVGLSGIVSVAAGDGFTIALKNDGTVWGWGENLDGALGDVSKVNRNTPALVKVQVRDSNGGLLWKNDAGGKPLIDADGNRIPVLVVFSGVTAISAGNAFSVALRADGTVWTWGYNWNGQLGSGITASRTTLPDQAAISGAVAISAGSDDIIVLKSDGTVWGWGGNFDGELGVGGSWNLPQADPVQAAGISGVVAIAEGDRSTLVLKNDGTVWAWGANWYGQLGDGTTKGRNTPGQVPGLSGITAIAAGQKGYSMALKNDGTVWTWGANWNGQLGDGTLTDRWAPGQVSGLADVTTVSAGAGFCLSWKKDGTFWAWGNNANGQLGDGSTTDRKQPVQVDLVLR
jgi:alpha-tubulin suppressor-like RCC1 family protein